MKFVFTKHALKKFRDLTNLDVRISRGEITETIKNSENLDKSQHPKLIASAQRDFGHVLRVVYKTGGDIITVITFYPARKGRYYEIKAARRV